MTHFNRHKASAFTLIELLVVVAIIALLISILLPSLARAREQVKSVKCLSNLKTLGMGVHIYASDAGGLLPGRLHPAVYRDQGDTALAENPDWPISNYKFWQSRQLTHQLREVMSDSTDRAHSLTDQVATCPTMSGLVPDSSFLKFKNSPDGHYVFPTHYAINNIGASDESGTTNTGIRATDPGCYFGYSSPDQSNPSEMQKEQDNPVRPLTMVRRQSEEWMIADAWYRPRSNHSFPSFQQEGPYQSAYSGLPLPNFAPHFGPSSYAYVSGPLRTSESSQLRTGRRDGNTNAVFFDGHGASVRSRRLLFSGIELLYGFPGTVNPLAGPETSDLEKQAMLSAYWE